MKKLLIILLLFIPLNTNACPHYDEDGNEYYMYYDSDNYDNTILVYPRGDYYQTYYNNFRDITMKEELEIPLYQKEDFYVMEENPSPKFFEADNINIESDLFSVDIPLEVVKEKIIPDNFDDISIISYVVQTRTVNEDTYLNDYDKIMKILNEKNIVKLAHDTLFFDSFQIVQDANYERKEVEDEFLDKFSVFLKNEIENIQVLKIDSLENDVINITSINFNDDSNFLVDESGYYVFVESEEEINSFQYEPEVVVEVEDGENNLIYLIALLPFVVVVYIIFNKKRISV